MSRDTTQQLRQAPTPRSNGLARGTTRSPGRDALRRLVANRMALFGGAIVLFFVFLALFGEALAPQNALLQDLTRISEPPSGEHWFGTDELGRDFFSRILAGARTALLVATLVTTIAAGLGMLIGLISAYVRGWTDSVLMRIADVLLAFPTFLLAAFLNATMRPPIARQLGAVATATGVKVIGSKEVVDFIVVF